MVQKTGHAKNIAKPDAAEKTISASQMNFDSRIRNFCNITALSYKIRRAVTKRFLLTCNADFC